VGILSENCVEYIELIFACAKLGAIVSALNWRLRDSELLHCLRLTAPGVLVVSPRFRAALERIEHGAHTLIERGEDYEARLAAASPAEPEIAAEIEDGLLVLYTSGTTGLPKGALLSQRAEIARLQLNALDMGLRSGDVFIAWAPMFHMVSTEQAIHLLLCGGKVVVVDGFDLDRILYQSAREPQWWLILMPGTIEATLNEIRRRNFRAQPMRLVGAMADLVPVHQIAELTRALNAPYANTFGATETGLPPASAATIPPGVVAERLSKRQTSLCAIRLVDPEDRDVADGEAGELAIRGPTLFSGYWNAPETNARDFRGGWFHMGDMFRRNPDGTLDFVDRVKYLIKSGGENIYPAEIERVLLSEPRVRDAVVVRKPDVRWGEVPVAFVASGDPGLGAAELIERCRVELAGYKRPREVHFVPFERLPRSTTGKIQRHEVEKWLKE
jgi:fatty-acyl-CoA synthase